MKISLLFCILILLLIIAYTLYYRNTSIVLTNRKEGFDYTFYKNQEIVIARYNENLNWINEEPFNRHPIIIYNKSNNDNFASSDNIKKVVNLPNVGRETNSYFYHIIENYDNLADITIFLPGSADLNNKYERSINLVKHVEEIGETTMSCYYNDNFVQNNYNFEIDDYMSSHENNRDINNDSSMQISNIRPFGNWFNNNFTSGEINNCISLNSIIAISRKNILQKPKSFYENLNNQLNTHQNPEVGHFLERSWQAIFYPYDEKASFIL
jgi:hypothetical protein